MGAVGMHMHWALESCYEGTRLHQFFLFDVEEYGFDSYESLVDGDLQDVQALEQTLINPLGGRKVPVTLREAKNLLQGYVDFNKSKNIPLPSGRDEYEFLLKTPSTLDAEKKKLLFGKQCTTIQSEYQLIHYFLMRTLSNDHVAAKFLSGRSLDWNLYSDITPATLCKNTIDEKDGRFMAESLTEVHNQYMLLVSRLKVEDMSITAFERISAFSVTSAEAAMMLARPEPEYVTVFDITAPPEAMANEDLEIHFNTMVSIHDNGRLFMAFNNNNKHVDRRVFRLNDDVMGLYYIGDSGEMIIAAYSQATISFLELDLLNGPFGKFIVPLSKYEFKEPVLYDFIQSDFDYFDEFVEALQADDNSYDD